MCLSLYAIKHNDKDKISCNEDSDEEGTPDTPSWPRSPY